MQRESPPAPEYWLPRGIRGCEHPSPGEGGCLGHGTGGSDSNSQPPGVKKDLLGGRHFNIWGVSLVEFFIPGGMGTAFRNERTAPLSGLCTTGNTQKTVRQQQQQHEEGRAAAQLGPSPCHHTGTPSAGGRKGRGCRGWGLWGDLALTVFSSGLWNTAVTD